MPFFYSRMAIYALMAVLTVVVLTGHHTVPPMDRDESRFAQASRQMQQSGDYITVRFQDDLRAKKPAGIYWLQSAFASMLGEAAISSYRFVNVLALLAAVFMLYHIGLQLYEPRTALAAATLFGTGFLVLGEAHLAKTDTVLMALILAQQWALFRLYIQWQTNGKAPANNWLWFWLAMAFGIMIKGPVAVVIAVLTVASLALWHRQIRWLTALNIWYGLLVVAVVCLPWAVMVSLSTDGAFLATAIKADLLAKVHSGQESHGALPGSYVLALGFLIWPATPLLIGFFGQIRGFLTRPETRFLLAWLVPFWIMMELIPTKLPHYLLPVLPALALLLAAGVPVLTSRENFTRRWQYFLIIGLRYLALGLGLGLGIVALWAALNFGGATSRRAVLFAFLGLLAIAAALYFGHLWIRQALWVPFFAMLGAGLVFHLILFSALVPALSRIHVSSAIASTIANLPARPTAVAASGYHEPSLVFLLGQNLLLLTAKESALFLEEAPGGMAIIEQRQNPAFLTVAAQLGLRVQPPIQLSGFNISKGQDVQILLYRTAVFDANASKE